MFSLENILFSVKMKYSRFSSHSSFITLRRERDYLINKIDFDGLHIEPRFSSLSSFITLRRERDYLINKIDFDGLRLEPRFSSLSSFITLRRERDSNPRYSYPYVSLANWWFQPLTHPSNMFKELGDKISNSIDNSKKKR